jgi:PKHD-type hydroxylase
MLLQIPNVLAPAQVERGRRLLEEADWVDGRVTAGHQSAKAKNNLQVPLFLAAALPFRVFPPLFNRYEGGQSFGNHVDNAIRQVPGTPHRIRTDLSATLFFTGPEEYDGGELVVEDHFGVHQVKLPAGHMVLYPASSLHHVRPVTRGVRLAAFFWIQSLVRDDSERTLLFDLDRAVQSLGSDRPDHPAVLELTNVYHNLLRRWSEL